MKLPVFLPCDGTTLLSFLYINTLPWKSMAMVIVLGATFNNIYSGSQFYWWMKTEYPEKTTDLSQITDKFYYIKVYWVHLGSLEHVNDRFIEYTWSVWSLYVIHVYIKVYRVHLVSLEHVHKDEKYYTEKSNLPLQFM